MKIKILFSGAKREVEVNDKKCKNYTCFHPHDCPVQGYGGVRESKARWMCLTNFLHGCPDVKEWRGKE